MLLDVPKVEVFVNVLVLLRHAKLPHNGIALFIRRIDVLAERWCLINAQGLEHLRIVLA